MKDISVLLSVSERTVKYRMKEFGLSVHSSYSNIDDDMLDSWVGRGLIIFPKAGKRSQLEIIKFTLKSR